MSQYNDNVADQFVLDRLYALVAQDPGGRGLARQADQSLFSACQSDFADACRALASLQQASVVIVTGFYIPRSGCAETDGPPGAIVLARMLVRCGHRVILAGEQFVLEPLTVALEILGRPAGIALQALSPACMDPPDWFRQAHSVVFIERPGPAHSVETLAMQKRTGPAPAERFLEEVASVHWLKLHNMRGEILDVPLCPVERWLSAVGGSCAAFTVGLGDGGNEIGMGKIPWEIIADRVPLGGCLACHVATDYTIVSGVSNWGAYALATGLACLTGQAAHDLLDADAECRLWHEVVQRARLVDGVTGRREWSVDGLPWSVHAAVMTALQEQLFTCHPR